MEAEVSTFGAMYHQKAVLEELPTQITDFLVSARAAQEHLVARERILEQRMASSEQFIDGELEKIQSVVTHFQRILEDAGAQQWRLTTEAIHKEGKEQVQVLQNGLGEVKKTLQNTCAHLETTSTQIVKGLTKTVSALRTGELEQLAEDSAQQVKTVAKSAINEMKEIGRWFHWKNIAMMSLLCLVVVLFTDLFVDDEWPWESHKNAAKERVAGQALLDAWPKLSLTDQQRIMDNIA